MAPSKGESLSPAQHTAIGALAGFVEVCIMQPTVGVKNALQEGRPVPRSPLILYRGLTINATSMAPITAAQFGANRLFEQAFVTLKGGDLGQLERVAVAAAAGSTSALISSPAELVMIQQQRTGGSLSGEARRVVSTYGVRGLYRGFSATVTRESLYTCGYLGVVPVLRDYLQGMPALAAYPESTGTIIAAITGGLFAATASQPADTVKTRMQAFLVPTEAPQYATARSTAQYIISQGGSITALWSGFTPRAARTVGAAFILTYVRDTCIGVLERKQEAVGVAASKAG